MHLSVNRLCWWVGATEGMSWGMFWPPSSKYEFKCIKFSASYITVNIRFFILSYEEGWQPRVTTPLTHSCTIDWDRPVVAAPSSSRLFAVSRTDGNAIIPSKQAENEMRPYNLGTTLILSSVTFRCYCRSVVLQDRHTVQRFTALFESIKEGSAWGGKSLSVRVSLGSVRHKSPLNYSFKPATRQAAVEYWNSLRAINNLLSLSD
jgi:hypothetical protein